MNKLKISTMKTIESKVPNIGFPVVEQSSLVFNGNTYTYFVLDTREFIEFAVACNYDFLAISESYPEKYRELALIHELIELKSPLISERARQCSCFDALQQELSIASDRGYDMEEYTKFRLRVFECLTNYYENKELGEGEAEILENLQGSRDYLRKMVAGYQ